MPHPDLPIRAALPGRLARTLALAATLAAVLLALPATASAASFHTDPNVLAGLKRAVALAWPGGPCTSSYVLQVVPRAVVEEATATPGAVGAAYQDGSCRVLISDTTVDDPVALCQLVVHEVGHTNGHGHVLDPNNIMSPELAPEDHDQPGCTWPALLGPTWISERDALRRVLVNGWKLYDAYRDDRGRMVVRAERRKKRGRGWERKTWTVYGTATGARVKKGRA